MICYTNNTEKMDSESSFLTDLTYRGTCLVVLNKISRTYHKFRNGITPAAYRGTYLAVFNKILCTYHKFRNGITPAVVEEKRSHQRRCKNNNSHTFYGFLLILSLLPISMSSPHGSRSSGKTTTDLPHWVNPCNGTSAEKMYSDESNGNADSVFINAVKLTAQQARYQAEKFREDYVLTTFRETLKDYHQKWKHLKYQWLLGDMAMPKDLGDIVSDEHLKKLSLEDESLKIYGYLQRLAVALEQLVLDHRNDNSEFKEEFTIAENNLRRILCEIRELIPDDKLKGFENAQRSIMDGHRHMNFSNRLLRDWLIFRDYMNLVEYIEQVMGYFEKKVF